jgi:hypothetical protein
VNEVQFSGENECLRCVEEVKSNVLELRQRACANRVVLSEWRGASAGRCLLVSVRICDFHLQRLRDMKVNLTGRIVLPVITPQSFIGRGLLER